MNWNNIPSRSFTKLYKKLPPKYQKKLIYILDRLDILPFSIKKIVKYDGIFKVKVDPGVSFKMINCGGEIENQIFTKGLGKTWEKDVYWIYKELCQISDVLFDIGANTGIYSLIAKSINRDIQVFAFEPSARIFEKLKTNIELNGNGIVSEQLAISNKSGTSLFYDTPNEHETAASLSSKKLKDAYWYKGKVTEYEVPVIKLSDYIKKNDIKQIDLLKLDIEMHEVEALEGLGEYLEAFKPVMIIEVLNTQMTEKMNSFFNLEDFKIFHLKSSGKAEQVSKFKMFPLVYETHEWNYLVFHKNLQEKIRSETSLFNNIF